MKITSTLKVQIWYERFTGEEKAETITLSSLFYYSAQKHNIFAHNKAVSLSEIKSSDILKHISFNERSKHANFTLGQAFPSTIVLADDWGFL